MKNIFAILCAFIMLISCQTDRDIDSSSKQFGFTIERDDNFIEKGVGESNSLKFNIKPNYDFSSLETSFKFSTNLDGVLNLNGQTLNPNQEYKFDSKENIFEYIGNVSGSHNIKITARNSKGVSKEEIFELKYAISEFVLTFTGGTAEIFQGDETSYVHKITPNNGNSSGYEIRFDSYEGTIKLNGVPAQLNQFYPINNINNFNIGLTTNVAGQGKLTYTIKNLTVQKPYEIQQTVTARKIVIESMSINAANVLPNTPMSFSGVIKKTPVTNNTTIKYKTWISSASNNNQNGLGNTQNAYLQYALGANGLFNINFNALEVGNYTINIQAQDEYGNESDVKSFNVAVTAPISFVGATAMELDFRYTILFLSDLKTYLKNFNRSFKVVSGGNSTITKIEYFISFNHVGQAYNFNYAENVSNGTNTYEVANLNFGIPLSELAHISSNQLGNPPVTNIVAVIKATSSSGATFEKTITPTFTFQGGL